jgi:hypothetical protein
MSEMIQQSIQWGIVAKVFGDRTACEDCPFFEQWVERHPYGMGTADETLSDCQLTHEPTDCPGFAERYRDFSDELYASIDKEIWNDESNY